MDIPPDIQLKTTIRAGSVYRFISEDFSSREPHWFIVANINPLNDTLILLTCITSKVDKRKEHAFNSGLSPDTLVEIGPDDYNELELPSIIDCNSPSETTKEKLISRLEKNELRICGNLNPELVKKIQNGIYQSTAVLPHLKKYLIKKNM